MSRSPRRWVVLGLWSLGMIIGCLWLAQRLSVTHDLSVFLPVGDSPRDRLLVGELQSGPSAQLILLAIQGGSEAQRAQASQALIERLRGDEDIAQVLNGASGMPGINAESPVLAYRFLLSPRVNAALFEADSLRAALEQRLSELSSGMSQVDKHGLPHDPISLVPNLLERWLGGSQPQRRHGVWFDATGEHALLMVHTRVAGFDLDRQEAVITRIRAIFGTLDQGGRLALLMTGPAVFAVQSRHEIRQQSAYLSLAASLAIMLILLVGYRSWRVALLGAVPVASALVAGISLAGLLTGPIHGIALAFAIVLVGVTLDYPLHLFSHARPGESLDKASSSIGPALLISASTTALAFGVLVLGDFRGLIQLGLITGIGVLTAAVVTRWVLPAMMIVGANTDMGRSASLARMIQPAGRHGRTIMFSLAVLMALALGYLHAKPDIWEDDLGALSPVPAPARALDQQLRQAMGAPDVRHIILIPADEQETALQRSERVAAVLDGLVMKGLLQGYDHAARYLPSAASQKLRQEALPSPEQLEAELAQALDGLPFKSGYFKPFVQDVAQARGLPALDRSMLAGTPLDMRIGALLRRDVDGWKALVVLQGVRDAEALTEALRNGLPDFAHHIDLKAASEEVVSHFRIELLEHGVLIAAAIMLILLAWMRSPMRLLRALLPVMAALVLTVAVLLLLGEKLTLFHLVALLLVLGLAVDYTVFMQSHATNPDEGARTVHALLACVASTTAVFALLASSTIPVLHAIGITVALGVPFAVLAGALMHRHGKVLSCPANASSENA